MGVIPIPLRRQAPAAAALICALLTAGVYAAVPAAAQVSTHAAARQVPPGTRLWVSRYNGPAGGDDVAASEAASNAANLMVVTGASQGKTALGHLDYATVAYNTLTGARMWVSRYNGPGDGNDLASSVAFNPSGAAVYVTGGSAGSGTGDDYATVAYDAATGKELWASRYNGPGNGNDQASSVAVSRDGMTVFVTGGSPGATSQNDYATIAYDSATGAQLWLRRYNGPGNGKDFGTSIGVSPDGSRVFVTGGSTRNGKDTASTTPPSPTTRPPAPASG